jgi:streptogramin lyase
MESVARLWSSERSGRSDKNSDGPVSGHSVALILALVGVSLAGVARSQAITEFPLPHPVSDPAGIAAGSDGNLWFPENASSKIGRMTTAGVVVDFPLPTTPSGPKEIAAGPDGNLWFTEFEASQIGRITTAGAVAEFPVLTEDRENSQPAGIAAGPDGNLWFAELNGNKIGRITTAGVITEFPIPTAGSQPYGIAAGPDGNLWFAEFNGNKIGRITTAGAVTEFVVPTVDSGPIHIVAGPDGNLWFTAGISNQIGRITTAGVIIEFSLPMVGSAPEGIAAGADGNLWFTEESGNQIGRLTTAGALTEFPIPTAGSFPIGIAAGPDGNLWFTEFEGNQIGQITTRRLTPKSIAVDAHAVTGSSSDANGVLEPGETVEVAPSWRNRRDTSQTFTGSAADLVGPSGATYTLMDNAADYGTVAGESSSNCHNATGDCYLLTVLGSRPAQHWDATFIEDLSVGSVAKTWTLHIGNSFPDVPTSYQFYSFIENLFHNGITGGCTGGNFCPTSSVTRAQMAVFLMKSKLGASETPPPATGTLFADVPASNSFAPWIEQLAGFKITGGCGSGNFCPNDPVTRAQMAVFLLKSEHGSGYIPPPCTGMFPDVLCPSTYANWIEEISHESITGGCGSGDYCPNTPVNRGQMAVFLVKTFGLLLYGP